jgi:hypothetical protein
VDGKGPPQPFYVTGTSFVEEVRAENGDLVTLGDGPSGSSKCYVQEYKESGGDPLESVKVPAASGSCHLGMALDSKNARVLLPYAKNILGGAAFFGLWNGNLEEQYGTKIHAPTSAAYDPHP